MHFNLVTQAVPDAILATPRLFSSALLGFFLDTNRALHGKNLPLATGITAD